MPNAAQLIYKRGVPHTDRHGNMLSAFDPDKSFLPMGIYHFMKDDFESGVGSFDVVANAGFNFVHSTVQRPVSLVDDAAKAGVQLLIQHPSIIEVKAYKDHPSIWAWYLDEEPTGFYWGKGMAEKFIDFVARREEIKSIDSIHPVFILDCCWITPPATEWWVKWNTSGDITCHDNYPVTGAEVSLSGQLGIPESISLAVSANREETPMLFCAQAHYYPHQKHPAVLPSPQQERCMIYTALIHGATGIIYFGVDSWVMREGDCIGFAPDPKIRYNDNPKHISATEDQLQASRFLWGEISRLNSELTEMRPSILSPTADVPYSIALDDQMESITENPIRTILKENPDGGYTLLLANVDSVPQRVKIRFPDTTVLEVKELFESDTEITQDGDTLIVFSQAYDARAFSINF